MEISACRHAPAAKLLFSVSLLVFLTSCAPQDPVEGGWKLPGEDITLELRSDGTLSRITSSTTSEGSYNRDESGNLFLDMGDGKRKAVYEESNDELRVRDNRSNWNIFLRKPAAAMVDSAQAIFSGGYKTRDCDSSITLYSQAISLLKGIPSETGHLARAYNNRGICEEKNGNTDAALADYNKAIDLDPRLEVAYGNRAWLYETLGKKNEAYADYKKAAGLGYLPAIYWVEQHEKQQGEKIAEGE